jgi:hypothetical protein
MHFDIGNEDMPRYKVGFTLTVVIHLELYFPFLI